MRFRRASLPTTTGTGMPLRRSPENSVKVKELSTRSRLNPSTLSKNPSRHEKRRSSPSVMACSPTRSCMATASRIAASSIARSASRDPWPTSTRCRASINARGRIKLPT
jgi:hypothetical protein